MDIRIESQYRLLTDSVHFGEVFTPSPQGIKITNESACGTARPRSPEYARKGYRPRSGVLDVAPRRTGAEPQQDRAVERVTTAAR